MAMSLGLTPPEGVVKREYIGVTVVDAPAAPSDAGQAPVAPPEVEEDASVGLSADSGALAEDVEDDSFFDDEEDYADDDYDPTRDSPEALQAAGWIRSGIVFSVVGGVLSIGGVLMALSDPMDLAAGNGSQELARDRAAQAMGIPGGALIAGGIAMIVVGKRQKKRLRASLRALRRGVGLGVTMRF
jgi:hypothetical protein